MISELIEVLCKRLVVELGLAEVDNLERPAVVGRAWRARLEDALAIVSLDTPEDDRGMPDALDQDARQRERERLGEAVREVCAPSGGRG